jgi:hypothetical protein
MSRGSAIAIMSALLPAIRSILSDTTNASKPRRTIAAFSSIDAPRGRLPAVKPSTVTIRKSNPAARAPSAMAMVAAPCAVPISTIVPPPHAAALS